MVLILSVPIKQIFFFFCLLFFLNSGDKLQKLKFMTLQKTCVKRDILKQQAMIKMEWFMLYLNKL